MVITGGELGSRKNQVDQWRALCRKCSPLFSEWLALQVLFGNLVTPSPFIPLPLDKGKGEVVREGLRLSQTPYKHI